MLDFFGIVWSLIILGIIGLLSGLLIISLILIGYLMLTGKKWD
ncbi:MAG: hypothetical protein ACXAC7_05685 [Candidatus Hodarchaeales archaeon]